MKLFMCYHILFVNYGSFTDEQVITLKYRKLNLTEHLKICALKVQKTKINKWQNMKIWLADIHKIMDLLKKTSNHSLFDQDEKIYLLWSAVSCQNNGPE